MTDEELSDSIRKAASYHTASDHLRAAVVTHIALQSAARDEKPSMGQRIMGIIQIAGLGGRGVWVGFAGGLLVSAMVAWMGPRLLSPSISNTELIAYHVRAMGSGPLFEVASSDRHTVKPWFQGKLDYAPEVVDVSGDGFQLLGGRIDSVGQLPTAALVYGARQHFISVFERPSDAKRGMRGAQQRGFNLVHWSDGVMDVWAVSDVEASELDRFAQAWSRQTAPATVHTPPS